MLVKLNRLGFSFSLFTRESAKLFTDNLSISGWYSSSRINSPTKHFVLLGPR